VVVAAIVTFPFFGGVRVLRRTILSVVALIPNYTTETPTDVE
jgi:hypothetical protein